MVVRLCTIILLATSIIEAAISLPSQWSRLTPILESRLHQIKLKMKLSEENVKNFENFISNLKTPVPQLLKLQTLLPKTTLELLRSVAERNVPLNEAESMARYLYDFTVQMNMENTAAFDENTSHIIGREWNEIDYSGENMTWQEQQKKYARHGIHHFKSEEYLKNFFKVESKLPYFKRIYKPKGITTDLVNHAI